jgi:N6-L-threonylcarbamoyladenine synthase
MPEPQLVLAFDTASENVALAIGRRERDGSITLIAADDHPARRQANVRLMPAIDALFAANGLSRADVACVVCGLGPGSFTGVRIGVATAKGIARGLRVPLFGVSTLDAVAWGVWLAGIRGNLGVVADAMRGEVYPARFMLGETGAMRLDPHTVAKADDVALRWQEAKATLLLVGDGLHKYAATFSGHSAPAHTPLSPPAPLVIPAPHAGIFLDESVTYDGASSLVIPAPRAGIFGCAAANSAPGAQSAHSIFSLGEPVLWMPTGAGLLRAFEDACARGVEGTGEAGTLLPLYTRLSDAEENERKRLADGGQIAQGALVDVPLSGVTDPARLGALVYRPMAADDLDQVSALEQASFPVSTSTSGECWTRAQFADELARKDRSWWIACIDELLVGFAGGWVVDGVLQVLDVVVVESHRRRGIARELLKRLMQDGVDLGATRVSLEVRASKREAQALYTSLGFERIGTRPDYYAPRNGEPREAAVIMERESGCQGDGCQGDVHPDNPTGCQGARPPDSPDNPRPRILAIETSCDETAAAVIDGAGQLLSDTVASQVDFHARFGGVVPEIASRKHTEAIVGVVDAALEEAGLSDWRQLDALAVTYAPGLIGALVVGVAFAKGLSWASGLKLIRVNHLEGHIYANRLAEQGDRATGAETGGDGASVPPAKCSSDKAASSPSVSLASSPPVPLVPPFVIALLSGGHTMLVHVRDWGDYHILGQTLDDAVGEAFDKVAKALGLGYPGGPVISRLAAQGNPAAFDFPRALLHSHDYRFSLSGLKTAVITFIRKEQAAARPLDIPGIAASFQQAVIDVQVAKALAALEETDCTTFCLGGGVAANRALREAYEQEMTRRGIRVVFPPNNACTDNAAMIARVALDRFHKGCFMALDDDAFAQGDLESSY